MSQGPEGCTRLCSRAGGVGVYGVEVPSSSTPAEDFLWRGGAPEPPAGGAQVALSAPWPVSATPRSGAAGEASSLHLPHTSSLLSPDDVKPGQQH